MMQLTCPHCGQRNQSEFRFGGEYNPRPPKPMQTTDEAWADYIYMRENKLGTQKEWWYHRSGCGTWFLAERHTKTNVVAKTYLWEPST
ncbi:MAG: sarcosine oxidase subunit delta [Chloroflexota bacterium]